MATGGEKLKIAANLQFLFKEVDFLHRFQAAAKAGFKAVECGAESYKHSKEDIVKAKEAAAVDVVLLNSPAGDCFGFASIPDKTDEFKKSVTLAIEYATALKCSQIHVLAGGDPEGRFDRDLCQQTYVSNVSYAANECKQHDITVMIEPISVMPGYFLQRQSQALEVIKTVNLANVKLQCDIYHAQRMGGNIAEFLIENVNSIGHIQIAQVPGRHEPNSSGELDYSFIFRTLLDLKYNKWIGCEYAPQGTTEGGLDWIKGYPEISFI